MNRSEIIEVRKIFSTYKEGESAAGNMCGCFINTEKKIKGRFSEKFLKRKPNEIRKYYDLFKKVLANNISDIHFDKEDKGKDQPQFLLDKLKATDLSSEPLENVLFEKVAKAVPEGNYALFLLSYSYDVPVKTKDKKKVDDASEEEYNFIICAVCPVKAQKSTLGYDPEKEKLGENPQQMAVENPVFGFLYPAFNGRTADSDNVSCFRTESFDVSEALFGHKAPDIEAAERKTAKPKTTVPATTVSIGNTQGDVFDYKEKAYISPTANIPSLDSGVLSNENRLVREREIEPETEKPERKASDEGMVFAEKKKPVRITGDKSKVKKKIIEGVSYWIVPVGDADLI